MTSKMIKQLKYLCQQKRIVRLITRHSEGDRYDGIVLSCSPKLILLQSANNFMFDGILALPLKRLKGLRAGSFEKLQDQILSQNGQIKKLCKLPWLRKVRNIRQMLEECKRRKIWPSVEMQWGKDNAFYIGPIKNLGKKKFKLNCYDAAGNWEKIYSLTYSEIVKVEIFDTYAKYFNRFMAKKPQQGKRVRPMK